MVNTEPDNPPERPHEVWAPPEPPLCKPTNVMYQQNDNRTVFVFKCLN